MANTSDTDQAIRSRGLRRTMPRSLVARTLHAHAGHHTVGEIQRLVEAEFGEVAGMARSSVYRALEALEEAGLVQAVRAGQEEVQFEWADDPHHHLICTDCGHSEEVRLDAAKAVEREASHQHGFHVAVRHLALKGTCQTCTREQQAPAPEAPRAEEESPS